jgi:metallo-beta-lactamase family protein
MVLLEHAPSGQSVLFSGDLGRPGRPLMPDPAEPPRADLVVVESTYGDRIHDEGVDVATQLAYARMKAGLGPREPVEMFRFKVEKYT